MIKEFRQTEEIPHEQLTALIPQARELLDHHIQNPLSTALGNVTLRSDIQSSMGPFSVLHEYKTEYPTKVTSALNSLYAEYNAAFRALVAANREWESDYQYCQTPDGTPINYFVQIDMIGLPVGFLAAADSLDEIHIREVLRERIFEIENSLAMYQLLESIFADRLRETFFKKQFRASLNDIRQRHQRPIALLAVTDQKYQAMKESEFGKAQEESLSDEEVVRLSGFDKFFGPGEFMQHLEENGGESKFLLYVRSSEPVAKLRKPELVVENPLLADDDIRRIIKAYSLTFNIDDPRWLLGDHRRINDSKAYLPHMNMAHPIIDESDIGSPMFVEFLKSRGISEDLISSGEAIVRSKPLQASYGCYGHERGPFKNSRFLKELRSNLRKRGPYIIQPELQTPLIQNETDGETYTYIDRNFFSTTDGQNYRFMGGFRSLMHVDSPEAKKGRVHGSSTTIWGEIL